MSRNGYLKTIGVDVYRRRPKGKQHIDEEVMHESPDDASQPEIEFASKAMADDQSVAPAENRIQRSDSFAGMDLVQLSTIASTCERCSLSRGRTNVVFGSGSETAQLMFIGEGPGAEEDRQGLPFVGRAGNLLTSMITALGFTRDEVYICNVVKCRPPGNRDPSSVEAKACTPYLRRQIELIQPRVIVALGRISAQLLLDTELPLGHLRRQTYKFKDTEIDLVVTYHPAYLLRKPTEKAKSWEDLWNVRLMLNEA